jgi:hypothetical protein
MKSIGSLLATLLLVAWALSPLQASATLVPSPDGITVYDTVNDISWLADADLAATNRFGLPVCTGSGTQPCVNPSGSMNYQAAAAWVQAMNAANYLGHTNWQLPTTPLADSSCGKVGPQDNSFGFGCTLNALGSLYYNALGLKAPNTAVPIPSNTAGPFSNFQPNLYWSQTIGGVPADACYASMACGNATFSFNTGFQGANTLENFIYALPTIAGKIAGTPTATGTGLQVNPGGQTVYDPVTNVTWLANANLAASNTFGLPYCTSPTTPAVCVSRDGAMTLAAASQFISNMNAAAYLGQTNWELPPIGKSCSAYNCNAASDPMAELFYSQLGFKEGTPVVATPDIAVGPFNNIQPYLYWSCQANTIQDACQSDGPATGFEWSFSFGNGFLGTDIQANDFYVTAYFDGPPTSVASPTETPASTSPPTSSPTTTPTGTCTATPTQVPTATRAHTAPATVLATPAPSSTVRTPTPTPSATVHSSATPTPPSSPTPSRSTTPTGSCAGDCNGDGQVTVDEILAMVNIALGNAAVTTCEAGDANHDGMITVDEILTAVDNALNGCGA